MDNDRQIPLKFLEEAEDCCDRIESTVLGLASTIANPQELDQALRAAHSVKGGAAMMGFTPLSRIAHQLEDFFKILRVRYHSRAIDAPVETLLLQGVDCLREVIDLHRQDQLIDEGWFSTHSQPIVDQLHQYLGDLKPEDEDALLSQEGDVNPALLLFESGVQEALDFLAQKINELSPKELRSELIITADQLTDFGRMAKLDRFIALCVSIKEQSQFIAPDQVIPLVDQALKIWRKSHSLVLLGRSAKIPTSLPTSSIPLNSGFMDDGFNPELTAMESLDLSMLTSTIANLDFDSLTPAFDEISLPSELLNEVSNFDSFSSFHSPSPELLDELASWSLPELTSIVSHEESPLIEKQDSTLVESSPNATSPSIKTTPQRQTVRVPVEYLQQFNDVFGKLILERNAINLRLAEINEYTTLLRRRMQHLEESHQVLRQWYDSTSTERLIGQTANQQQTSTLTAITGNSIPDMIPDMFDILEMDRYSDLHLLSQDQMETIVQLQEVTADIELSLRDMTQSVQGLNHTTRTLQGNITRTQMLPFGDIVKRFPRVIRDLSVQFGKSVNLKILGENTGIDRSIVDLLGDPLLHILRNAFDHGIEDPATRVAKGKPSQGTITLEASHRHGETIITMSDDGGGINIDRICHRLQQMGIPVEEIDRFSRDELLNTIFEPGFSTASSLTELSGRGVGMDIVRTNIEQVKGKIQVKTELGIGTTFTIRLPFTLSVVRVMLLERSGFVFAITTNNVREIIAFDQHLVSDDGQNISWQSQVIPLIELEKGISFNRPHRSLELSKNPTINKPTVLILSDNNLSIAYKIDRYWGEQEVTSRLIDSLTPLTPGVNNSIILGDGRVVPLIDLMELVGWMSTKGKLLTNVNTMKLNSNASLGDRQGRCKVLVVDDSINVRRYLATILEREGYEVEQAKDGQEAVDKLYGGLIVQGVICDVEMPRLDGYGVIESLRSTEIFEDLPIIMLTSRSSDKHRTLAMNLGASAYFSKPYNEADLLTTLNSLIKLSNINLSRGNTLINYP